MEEAEAVVVSARCSVSHSLVLWYRGAIVLPLRPGLDPSLTVWMVSEVMIGSNGLVKLLVRQKLDE